MEGSYRHELKYSISQGDWLTLRPRLRTVLHPDPHAGSKGTYRIHSIYFDNYQDSALREKIQGLPRREKYRIRWYDDDLSFLTLEKKIKAHGLCMKFDAAITYDQCRQILANDTDWMLKTGNDLLREFCCRSRQQLLRPRVLVSYLREPYVYAPGNVRITFDSDIRTSLQTRDFFRPDRVDVDAASETSPHMTLEVKYDRWLPGVVSDLLQLGSLRPEALSKYAACRRFG